MERSPSERQISTRLKQFFIFYGTRNFINVFTRAFHVSSPWTRSIESSTFHPISLRFILMLFFHVRLYIRKDLFPLGLPTKILHPFILFSTCATWIAHFTLTHFIKWVTLLEWHIMKILVMYFSPVSSLTGLNYLHVRNFVKRFVNMLIFRWVVVIHPINSQAGRPSLVGCLQLLIQFIHIYLPQLQQSPPSETSERIMSSCQEPTDHGVKKYK